MQSCFLSLLGYLKYQDLQFSPPRTACHSLHDLMGSLPFDKSDNQRRITLCNLSLRYQNISQDTKRKKGFSVSIPGISEVNSQQFDGPAPGLYLASGVFFFSYCSVLPVVESVAYR